MDFERSRELLLKRLQDAFGCGHPAEVDHAFDALAEEVNTWVILRDEGDEVREAFLRPFWRRLRAFHAQLVGTEGVSPAFTARLRGQMDLIRYLVHNGYGTNRLDLIQQNQGLLDALEKGGPQTVLELAPSFEGGDPWQQDAGIQELIGALLDDRVICLANPPTDPPTYELTLSGRGALADLRIGP